METTTEADDKKYKLVFNLSANRDDQKDGITLNISRQPVVPDGDE